MPRFGKQSLNSLVGQDPRMVLLMTEAIRDSPHDFTITDGGRTAAMQYALWMKGRDAKGNVIDRSKVVTNADGTKARSNHQKAPDGFYKAVDLYPYVDGKIDFNDRHNLLPVIAAHIKAKARKLGIRINWGGDFKATKTKPKGWDKPHFELA